MAFRTVGGEARRHVSNLEACAAGRSILPDPDLRSFLAKQKKKARVVSAGPSSF
jgi:hypothetical protein